MNRKWMTGRFRISLLLAIAFSAPVQLAAQVPVDAQGEPLAAYDDGVYAGGGVPIAGAEVEEIFSLTVPELEELVGPVALYPDDLLAIVLPASTYPLEIVQAARFLDQFEIDSSLEPDESWDESVVALLNYPEVLRMLDEQIDWTWRLGEAVIGQQVDLIAAVESFSRPGIRRGQPWNPTIARPSATMRALSRSEPVDKEIIYVPYYEPEEVVIYQPRRTVYNYYPRAYPVYYYPYPYGHSFSSGYFWGVYDRVYHRLAESLPDRTSPELLGAPVLRPPLLRPLLSPPQYLGLQHHVRQQQLPTRRIISIAMATTGVRVSGQAARAR